MELGTVVGGHVSIVSSMLHKHCALWRHALLCMRQGLRQGLNPMHVLLQSVMQVRCSCHDLALQLCLR